MPGRDLTGRTGFAVGTIAVSTLRKAPRAPIVEGARGTVDDDPHRGLSYGGIAYGWPGRTALFIGVQGRPAARCYTWPDRVPGWLRPVALWLCRPPGSRR